MTTLAERLAQLQKGLDSHWEHITSLQERFSKIEQWILEEEKE